MTPDAWCVESIGRALVSVGGLAPLRDLSVSMEGEEARLAAREWIENAGRC